MSITRDKVMGLLSYSTAMGAFVRWVLFLSIIFFWKYIVYTVLLQLVDVNWGRELKEVVLVGGPFAFLSLVAARYRATLVEQMTELATTDVLTGLRNRRAFWSEATEMHLDDQDGLVLILDADHFKAINDTYGHSVGDICLQAIATKIRQVTRETDIVGRIGGEEFGVYLPGATMAEAQHIGDRICKGVTVSVENKDLIIDLTISAGAARARRSQAFEDVVRRADEALYEAKRAGRARLVFCNADMPA